MTNSGIYNPWGDGRDMWGELGQNEGLGVLRKELVGKGVEGDKTIWVGV